MADGQVLFQALGNPIPQVNVKVTCMVIRQNLTTVALVYKSSEQYEISGYYCMLNDSTKCFNCVVPSSLKCRVTNYYVQIWISPACQMYNTHNPSYINTLIIWRLLQGVYNHATR